MYLRKTLTILLLTLPLIWKSGEISAQNNQEQTANQQQKREAEFYFTEGEKYYILEDYSKALVLFKKSVETDHENAAAHFKIAQIYRQMGDLISALENATQATQLAPDNKYYYAETAEIYTRLNEYDKAIDIYKHMINEMPATQEYYFELAAIYLYQQKFDDALEMYNKIEKSFGISEEIIIQKQSVLLEEDRIDEALAEGQKLIEAFPYEEKYLLRQVELYYNNDRTEEAIAWINEQLKDDPENGALLLTLSELQLDKGGQEGHGYKDEAMANMKKAFHDPSVDIKTKVSMLADFKEKLAPDQLKASAIPLAKILTEVHPESAEAWTIQGDIYQASGDKNRAKGAYVKALAFNPANLDLWQNVLQLLTEMKRMDSVMILSEDALEIYPNNGMLYYYNGLANLQKRKYNEAVYAFEQGKRLSSSNLEMVNVFNGMLGDAYYGLNDPEKADRAYEAVLDFDPENYVVLNNYSYFLSLRGEKLDKAEEMSARTVAEYPDNVTYLDTYAWVLFMRKKYKEAEKIIEKAIQTGNVSSIQYEHYGDILFKLGETDKAVIQWKKAADLNPNSKEIERKITEKSL